MGSRIEVCLLVISIQFLLVTAQTNPQDSKLPKQYLELEKYVIRGEATSRKDVTFVLTFTRWCSGGSQRCLEEHTAHWVGSDPCGSHWDGIQCNNNTRVTSIELGSIGLTGQFTWDITPLSELQTLDLSYNKDLTGTLTPAIGNLTKLTTLILADCNFYGTIPPTIGYLQQLSFLSLNSNRFRGKIPPSIGNLSNLNWLDLTNNNLSGTIPVSSGATLGLDRLVKAKHFHFGNNQLSGPIPPSLFHSGMKLVHVIFDSNKLTGNIPSTLGLVQTLIVVRLDWNLLTGTVPSNFSSLVNLHWLYLSNNQLTGPVPNLSGLNSLSYMDLSNNTFNTSLFPSWLSNLEYLTTILMENTSLVGQVPPALFSLPELQNVSLSNNQLTGALNVGSNYSNQLTLVDLQNNSLSNFSFTERVDTNVTFILAGNPYCDRTVATNTYCGSSNSSSSYSPPDNCPPRTCSSQQRYSPNCTCALPYTGTLAFTSPPFSVLNSTIYTTIQNSLMSSFQSHQLPVDSVSLSYPTTDTNHYFEISLAVFPSGQNYFSFAGILGIASLLSQVSSLLPSNYGFVYFSTGTYVNYAGGSKSSNTGVIIGVAVGGSVLLLLALLLGFYALRQKRRAENTGVNNPFAAWDPNTTTGAAPLVQGAKYFSFEELKKYTNDFSEANSIGSGGYGKVYRGTLPDGQLVAIKRAKQASARGGMEFKMEIELLSRVHHMNVVGLVGFCFDQSEQMLVYEYIANGTLNESLSGKTGIRLDWMRRLRIALGAARGLQYLHELANPPIIHRDIKSNNILLDARLNAKVADFGLSKPMGDTDKSHISTQVKGTMGYMDPEYYMTQQVTEKSDVYSFGVVLLELVTARQPIVKGKYIVREVREGMDRDQVLYGLDKILDPAILDPTPKGLENFVDLAMKCVEEEGARRPSMGVVVKEIENIMQIAGLNPNTDSASSSATHEVDDTKGHIHPYTDDSLFVYSGTFLRSSN